MKESKINCIEGLRTIGWIGVFLCHFKGAFFPNRTCWLDMTPIRFIYSGNAYVRLLFVISGFVLCYKYFVKECYDNVLGDVVKRYFRLMPPILCAEIVVYFLMKFNFMKNVEAASIIGSQDFLGIFNTFSPNIIECLKEALVKTYLKGGSAYIGPLWSIVYEYLGALLILAVVYIFKKSPWRWLFYIIFMSAFAGYYNYFFLGMIIADLYVNTNLNEIIKKRPFFQFCMILGGYLMLSMININDQEKYTRVVFAVGIVLFMLGILSSNLMERLLGNRLMVRGGKLAYTAYIVHWPIVETISCGLFLSFYNKIEYNVLVLLILIITFLVIIFVANIFATYIEPIGADVAKKLTDDRI